MQDLTKLTMVKKLLAAHGLSSAGTKAELVARMIEADPTGGWMENESNNGASGGVDVDAEADVVSIQSIARVQQREIDIYRREKEL